MNNQLRIIIILTILSVKAYGQAEEYNYFFHSYLIDSITIKENSIKSITAIYYQRIDAKDTIYKQSEKYYQFSKSSKLICSESKYYSDTDSIKPYQQTTDCFEYSDQGMMIEHNRFHDNRDSAEWIQKFSYEFNDNGSISKIIVNDFSVPTNSYIVMKYYDSDNRLIKEITDFDYLSEYKYDENGNLTEESSGPTDQQEIMKFYYDSLGNKIKILFPDNFEVRELTRKYDEFNRRIMQEDINSKNELTYCTYSYIDDTVKIENFDQDDILIWETNMIYTDSLIISIIDICDNKIMSKESFSYEFFELY